MPIKRVKRKTNSRQANRNSPSTPEFVVNWLNNGGLTFSPFEEYKAPYDGIKNLGTRERLLRELSEQKTDGYYRIKNLLDAFHRGEEPSRIDPILDYYKLIPCCRGLSKDGSWDIEWLPLHGFQTGVDLKKPGMFCPGEIEVLQQVLTMAIEGTLERLKSCHCGRWYLRQRFDQNFCSPPCRTHSEIFKAHRRQYMRKYYHDELRKNSYIHGHRLTS